MSELVVDWIGGNCPVQAEGTYKGRTFYFRARGEHMQMHIAPMGSDDVFSDDAWYYEEEYGDDGFAAGWAPLADCKDFMGRAFSAFDKEPLSHTQE
jgi:hypothetical protein